MGHTTEKHERGIATYDHTGRFRFSLLRHVEAPSLFDSTHEQRQINFLMLNPSTATAATDDPTIRRCVGFARSWGFARVLITNLFALRSTNPMKLYETPEPIGEGNDRAILQGARESAIVVCAWGAHGRLGERGRYVAHLLQREGHVLQALAFTMQHQPAHPLYLPKYLTPSPFNADDVGEHEDKLRQE